MGKSSKTFSEIMQVGVENIGTIDACETAEILMLAAASLEAIEPDYRLSLSHMGFVTGLLATCHAESEKDKQEVLSCLKTKNAHDLYRFLISHAVSEENARNVSNLILFSGDWKQTAALAKKAAIHEEMQKALDELEQIFSLLAGSRYSSHLSLDLTVLSDVDYYNGIIMQGYVRSCPRSVLSGGRYDLLLEKFKHSIGAMGFAVCLGDLNSCYPDESAYDFDTLLVYDSHDKYEQVLARASKLRSEGKKVRISRECQQNLRYEQLEKMDGGSLC
jgi:ATP phosphoribosyltransferase regulatory subunit